MHKYAICNVSVAPVRKEPKDQAEMVSQLLFGEKLLVLENQHKWCKIKQEFDGYEGWVDPKQIIELEPEHYHQINHQHYCAEPFSMAIENQSPTTLVLATPLPNYKNNQITIANRTIEFLGESIVGNKSRKQLVQFAMLYINVPYLWGGKSNFGIDCSGFVQQVFKMAGLFLPRDAYQQAEHGKVLSFIEEAQAGDLAFFDNEEGNIIHIGIVLEHKKIIHAHGKVRIDLLDSNGIFNTTNQSYSHKLRFVRSLLD